MAINTYSTVTHLTNMLPALGFGGPAQDGTQYTVILNDLITRASRAIDTYTNRKPGAYRVDADETLYYDAPRGMGYLYYEQYGERMAGNYGDSNCLWIDELAAAPTSIGVSLNGQLSYTALAATDYILWPYNAPSLGEPYIRIDLDLLNGTHSTWYGMKKGVQIVGKFGYSTSVPADIEQATLIQAARWWKRAQTAWQDKINLIDNAQALTYLNAMDSDVKQMIDHYRKMAV